MTTRNAARYLRQTIDSIINQTYQNWELIITNNQSTDDTHSILHQYRQQEKRIKVFHNDGNAEIIDGLQQAFSKSSGNIITRMDSDDLMPPDKLEKLVSKLLQNGEGHIVTGKIRHFSDDVLMEGFIRYDEWLNKLIDEETSFSQIYKECVIPSSCWMVFRTDFIKCGAFGRKIYPEDYDLCFRFYEQGLRLKPVKEVMHLWRDHPLRISRTDVRYEDQLYYDLKLYYFLRNDYIPGRPLVLWGAGNKGKKLARKLITLNVPFHWICNNENKIGHKIYNVELLPIHFIQQKEFYTILLAVSSRDPEDLHQIVNRSSHQFWWFC